MKIFKRSPTELENFF